LVDFIVLKRLTLKSDLGWFRSIFYGHDLKTKQKGITLNKDVANDIWPNLLVRQEAYEAAKEAQEAAKALGAAGRPLIVAEKAKARAIGMIPIHTDIYGPDGKPPITQDRIIILQDKNWRINGAFVEDPPSDPNRFFPVMEEGDLALIGVDGIDWPVAASIILLSQNTSDSSLWADLSTKVSKGSGSMIQLQAADVQTLADAHGLPADHPIRRLISAPAASALPLPAAPAPPILPPVAPPALPHSSAPPTAGAPTPGLLPAPAVAPAAPVPITALKKPGAVKQVTEEAHTEQMLANALTGVRGEKMVNAYLADQNTLGGPVPLWMASSSAEHPYDFGLLEPSGALAAVVDAKATSTAWPSSFFMSMAELTYAATSDVPYFIYRVSEVSATGGILRTSGDVRDFAKATALSLVNAAPVGTRVTGISISPVNSGLTWSAPIALPSS
jgi:hypothetical protein